MNRMERMVKSLKAASIRGVWDGKGRTPYFASCRQVDYKLGISAMLTRDAGYHSSGWWKSPDYERCLHLSLSFFDPETGSPRPRDARQTKQLLSMVFAHNQRLLWCEPPYSDQGKRQDIWHYRLFCDPGWGPIMPRGEVYNTELTEAGWRSFSDVQFALNQQAELEAGIEMERRHAKR